MISLDTNLLLLAHNTDAIWHDKALAFLTATSQGSDVVLSELTLTELYGLLRNPAILKRPYSAPEAVELIQQYRCHPSWRVHGFPESDSARLHDSLWNFAARSGFAFRRIYDARLALVLRHFGVTEFATMNVKDFQGFGFAKVWNPLED